MPVYFGFEYYVVEGVVIRLQRVLTICYGLQIVYMNSCCRWIPRIMLDLDIDVDTQLWSF